MATWYVHSLRERPDFRLVVTFLWGELHDVDSDGDASNPAARDWTWLYLKNRANPAEVVNVDAVEDKDGCFRVESHVPWLAAAVAYFLATEGRTEVSREPDESRSGPHTVCGDLGAFDWRVGTERAQQSIWRYATLADPYPNLKPR